MGALEEVGLTDLEETVYLATFDRPRSTATELAQASALTRARVARALNGLEELGLVGRVPDSPDRYVPVQPDLAVGVLLRQREERLHRVRGTVAALSDRYLAATRAGSSAELVEVVHGPDAIHQRWLQLQRSARSEIRVLDKPPYIDAGNPAEQELLVTGVRYRTVYDQIALEHPGKLAGIWEAAEAGENCRIGVDVPIKLFIADDRLALAPLQQPGDVASAVIVHPSALLDALIALFESAWRQALPFASFNQASDELPNQQRRILQLLASGCTEQTIARHLDIGYRTAQRQIRALMEHFGVHTRYQLGMRAAQLLGQS